MALYAQGLYRDPISQITVLAKPRACTTLTNDIATLDAQHDQLAEIMGTGERLRFNLEQPVSIGLPTVSGCLIDLTNYACVELSFFVGLAFTHHGRKTQHSVLRFNPVSREQSSFVGPTLTPCLLHSALHAPPLSQLSYRV